MLPGGWRDGREHGAGGALTNRRERAKITGKMQTGIRQGCNAAFGFAAFVQRTGTGREGSIALWIVLVARYMAVCVCEPVTWVVCVAFFRRMHYAQGGISELLTQS